MKDDDLQRNIQRIDRTIDDFQARTDSRRREVDALLDAVRRLVQRGFGGEADERR